MPLPLLAIPVLHSSGAWIAYAGSSYIAGTLSSSWVGAFILGNASLLSSTGLVSALGLAGASGVLTSIGASAAAGVGTALGAVGLGSFAGWLGIAPAATFLGLTPVGWAVLGSSAAAGALAAVLSIRFMRKLNTERTKGGLQPISAKQLIREIREFEDRELLLIMKMPAFSGVNSPFQNFTTE